MKSIDKFLTYKSDIFKIYTHAVKSVGPDRLMPNSIKLTCDKLLIQCHLRGARNEDLNYDVSNSRMHVIGGGKCVLAMANALGCLVKQANLQHKFGAGSLSIPIDLAGQYNESDVESNLNAIKVKCLPGSKNNLPDFGSVEATQRILETISEVCDIDRRANLDSFFLVLLSGGGSACLTKPKYISLERKLELVKNLVQRGANIIELNKVRRYYSHVKGGQLAKHILKCNPKSKILTLIISDVVGDPLDYIASGPTFIEPTEAVGHSHRQQMLQVLDKYNLAGTIGGICDDQEESMLDSQAGRDNVVHRIIGNNQIAIDCALSKAEQLGYQVHVLDEPLMDSTDRAMLQLISFSERISAPTRGKQLFIAGGETTVKREPGETWGTGGRLQELCVHYMLAGLSEPNEKGEFIDLMLAGSTDGQDGPTDAAGCRVSLFEYHHLRSMGGNDLFNRSDLLEAKRTHDSYSFWKNHAPSWLLKTGLTGTNVMDLLFYMKAYET